MSNYEIAFTHGHAKRGWIEPSVEVVTVSTADGDWQYLDQWDTGMVPDSGRAFWITDCHWRIDEDGIAIREIYAWTYDRPDFNTLPYPEYANDEVAP
jgi:hypothetical protein